MAKLKKLNEKGLYSIDTYKNRLKNINKCIKETKDSLKELLLINTNGNILRSVRQESLIDKNVVSVFDSNLTRALNMSEDKLNLELIIVKVYYFDIAKSIISNGFYLDGHKYTFFSASAGQIRTKKFVAVREDLLKQSWNTLTCGLTLNKINSLGGVNVNKYLAYLALCNSATDVWDGFNIDKCIVVEDFETNVFGEVDLIDDKTYSINRVKMNVPITHTDGCGIILPKLSRKNFMIRLPWVKGLLASFDFVKFLNTYKDKSDTKIKDIYGKSYDIIKDDIQIIFTKSQFKMWKYYKDWDEYKNKFKQFQCIAGICNMEENEFTDAKLNYQMLQTLYDLSDKELSQISNKSLETVRNLSHDRETMLKVFGATKYNCSKNAFQESLLLYPELLQDKYIRETLREIKKSIEKDNWSAKLEVDGKYTFLIPDLYAFCEYLFMGNKNPNGLLKDKEVYCKLFNKSKELDCLRSPHLYIEHAVRSNVCTYDNDIYSEWFNTKAVYTSCHDLISKVLMFDNDGDKSLVVADETIINAAKRNTKNIVPLYYNMAKADAKIVDSDYIYKGMISAYTGGNIGQISNDITKIWNSEDIGEDELKAIKLLCLENNFTIDYAKTLYKPTRPQDINMLIRKYTKNKVPSFFMYAKDKTKHQVESINSSCVNRLKKILKPQKFNFSIQQLGRFNYKMLMSNAFVDVDEDIAREIISKYTSLTKSVNIKIKSDEDEANNYNRIYKNIVNELLLIYDDINYIVNVLVKQLFYIKKSKRKIVFWECFGNIVLNNLQKNIKENSVMCCYCGKRIVNYNSKKYCSDCAKEKEKQRKREWKNKNR